MRILTRAAYLALFVTSGCGFISVSVPQWSVSLNTALTQDTYFTLTPAAYSPTTPGPVTYAVSGAPSWLSIDATTGTLSGYPETYGSTSPITLQVMQGGKLIAQSRAISFEVTGDPLTQYAWYLNNSGQTSFAGVPAVAGFDLRARAVFRAGITGKGVTVAVSDTGVEIGHEDLKAAIAESLCRDYSQNAPYLGDPSPPAQAGDTDHGTSVAGILAARALNGVGARGIAPGVTLVGFNFLNNQSEPHELDQLLGDFDVHNSSWGVPTDSVFQPAPFADGYAAQIAQSMQSRSGKGIVYVRSAGNGFLTDAVSSTSPVQVPSLLLQASTQLDAEITIPNPIVVGAINSDGVKASYASAGPNLWVSSLGGEFAYDQANVATLSSDLVGFYGASLLMHPAMITTDQSSCGAGFSQYDYGDVIPVSAFERPSMGIYPLNSNCNYTSSMNGTSSASPSVAGIVALMLEANPNLTWRDVKYILATTARQIDAARAPGQTLPWSLPSGTLSFFPPDPLGHLSPAWITNAAGFKFHNWYGFGLADANAAVTAAKTYVSALGTLQMTSVDSGSLNVAIPDNNPTGVAKTLAVGTHGTIDAVQLVFSSNHTFPFELGIELYSPAGTRSIVLNTYNSFVDNANGQNFLDVPMLTNTFYGEPMAGTWTMKVFDVVGGDTGSITNWKLNVYYH